MATIDVINQTGAVVGSIVVSTATGLGRKFLNQKEQELLDAYQKNIDKYIEK